MRNAVAEATEKAFNEKVVTADNVELVDSPVITELPEKIDDTFDYKNQYSDEFYEQYIANFKPNTEKRLTYRFFKRSFDIVASVAALIVLALPMLIIAVAIRLDSKGPAIFKHERMGRNGKVFTCYKFRSMVVTAPKECATSVLEDADSYMTKVGIMLRRFSLDELPQLWCVFKGDMSVIGYRPLVLTEIKCNDMRRRMGVFSVRPGISGYSQVHGRDDVYYKNKAIMDAEYVKNANFWLDIKLIFQTVGVVLSRRGNRD